MNINAIYGLLPRAALRKVIEAKVNKSGIRLLWFHSLTSKDGYSLKSTPYPEVYKKIDISRRSFFYTLDELRELDLLFHTRSKSGFKAFSLHQREAAYIAAEMKDGNTDATDAETTEFGQMPYGTLPATIFKKAIKKKYRRSTLNVYWFLSLNSFAGEHDRIEFDHIRNVLRINLSEMWRAISQLQEDDEYKITKLHGGFQGFVPSIPEARAEAKARKHKRELIDKFILNEAKETKEKLGRKLHREERKMLRKLAEEMIAEGINPLTNEKLSES